MIQMELNPAGNFRLWPFDLLKELKEQPAYTHLGHELIFEDEDVRIWEILLLPGERLPFRKLNSNYYWIALTSGSAITRCQDGSVKLYNFDKGFSEFLEFKCISRKQDLKNVGDCHIELNFMEFKNEECEPTSHSCHRKTA